MENFERFRVDETCSCPVCRADGYAKRVLSSDDIRIMEDVGVGCGGGEGGWQGGGGGWGGGTPRTPRVSEPKWP